MQTKICTIIGHRKVEETEALVEKTKEIINDLN